MARCPFDILGVEPRFDLDLKAVAENHRALAKTLHPDKHAGTSASERRLALGHAIDVNDAVRVLKDPIKRAEALFTRFGLGTGEVSEPKPSPALLMEMMEAREELAEAVRKRDIAEVRSLSARVNATKDAALVKLSEAFRQADCKPNERTSILLAALPALGELRYAKRFADEVAAFEEALEDSPNQDRPT